MLAYLAVTLALFVTDGAVPQDVEAVARRYRIHAYNNYRTNRDEYDRRMDAADRALAAWRFAADQQSARVEINDWFAQATQVEDASDLPPVPEIPAATAEQLAEGQSGAGFSEPQGTSVEVQFNDLPLDANLEGDQDFFVSETPATRTLNHFQQQTPQPVKSLSSAIFKAAFHSE